MGRNLLEILSGVVIPRAPSSSSDASLDASSLKVSLLLTECFLGMVLGDSSGKWLGLGTLGSFLQDLAGQYSDSSLERLPGQSCCAPPQVSSTDPNLQVFLLQTCY